MKNKIESTIKRFEKYKKDIDEDPILIETLLDVLKYLLKEDIPHDQKVSLFNNISNTILIIEEEISKKQILTTMKIK